jgi:hypothetical protein
LIHGPPGRDEPYFGPPTSDEANAGYVVEPIEGVEPRVLDEQMTVGEVITLLDGFYEERHVRPLAPPTCVILKWGVEWLRRALFGDIRVEAFTSAMIRDLDVEANDPMDYVETHTYTNDHTVMVRGKKRAGGANSEDKEGSQERQAHQLLFLHRARGLQQVWCSTND